jgi:mannosyl-oligosaccharide glucosidase
MFFKSLLSLAGAVLVAADDSAILSKEHARETNQSLLWGAYRPNLYFGVRPRIPNSLMGGLMWSKVDTYQDGQLSRWPRH